MTEKRFNIEDGYYQGKSRPMIYDEESSDDYYFCGDYRDFENICKRLNNFDITNKHLKKENKKLKKQIEDLYENDKSLRKMMGGMSLNYQGVTVHRALYSEVLKILKENDADDLCSDLEKTSIDTSINGC